MSQHFGTLTLTWSSMKSQHREHETLNYTRDRKFRVIFLLHMISTMHHLKNHIKKPYQRNSRYTDHLKKKKEKEKNSLTATRIYDRYDVHKDKPELCAHYRRINIINSRKSGWCDTTDGATTGR